MGPDEQSPRPPGAAETRTALTLVEDVGQDDLADRMLSRVRVVGEVWETSREALLADDNAVVLLDRRRDFRELLEVTPQVLERASTQEHARRVRRARDPAAVRSP